MNADPLGPALQLFRLGIGACWIVFLAVWAALALAGRTGRRSSSPGARLFRVLIVLAVATGAAFGGRIPALPFGRYTTALAGAGFALCAAGLAFAVWARVALGRNWGMPMTLHERPELVTSGPYRYVRHPIYSGLSAMLLGTTLVFPAALPWAIAMIGYSLYSARREERDMAQRFPEAYPEYRRRSKSLVPFVF